MNIIKPQKLLLDNLTKIEDFIEETKHTDLLENKFIGNVNNEGIELYDIKFENVIFSNVNIISSKLEKNTFINVRFVNCNFSNTSFERSCFIRCEFNNCKIAGCSLIETRLYNVTFEDSNANYINLAMARQEKRSAKEEDIN